MVCAKREYRKRPATSLPRGTPASIGKLTDSDYSFTRTEKVPVFSPWDSTQWVKRRSREDCFFFFFSEEYRTPPKTRAPTSRRLEASQCGLDSTIEEIGSTVRRSRWSARPRNPIRRSKERRRSIGHSSVVITFRHGLRIHIIGTARTGGYMIKFSVF